MKWLLTKFFKSRTYQYFIFPLIVYLHNPFRTTFTARDVDVIQKYLDKTGLLVFGNLRGSLMGFMIPGGYSHVGIYDAATNLIYEQVTTGWQETTLYSFATRYTDLAIGECKAFDEQYAKKVVGSVRGAKGSVYNNTWALNRSSPVAASLRAFYCSGLIYTMDTEHRIQASLEDKMGLGMEYISPYGLYNAKNLKRVHFRKKKKVIVIT